MKIISKVIVAIILGIFLSACEPLTTWRICLTASCNWPYYDSPWIPIPPSNGPEYQAYEKARENRVIKGLDGAMMVH